MTKPINLCVSLAAVMLMSSNLSCAVEQNVTKQLESASLPKGHPSISKSGHTVSSKPVDINNAKREQLKKLPGIGDIEADKIIAGRPYLSKANLVTHDVIARGLYENIKKQIYVGKVQKNTSTQKEKK